MTRKLSILLLIVVTAMAGGQEIRIGIIDFYGLQRTPADDVRAALAFKNGDSVPEVLDAREQSEARLKQLPGVDDAHVNVVCCDAGRAIVYVGIHERGAPVIRFRESPRGAERLPADVVAAGSRFQQVFVDAIQRGQAGEDRTQGHALNDAPDVRAVQERFIEYARRDVAILRRVLVNSSDRADRALAAQVLGYVEDKQSVVDDLVNAMHDPAEEVRNNAMRALLVFTWATPTPRRPTPQVPEGPFVEFLSSPIWSDRNKSAGAVAELTRTRDPRVLASLRKTALDALVEMARWTSAGHAEPSLIVLARLAGRSDDEAKSALSQGTREAIINAAIASARR